MVRDIKKSVTLTMIQGEFRKLYDSMLSGSKRGHVAMANNIEKLAHEYRQNSGGEKEEYPIYVNLAWAMSMMDSHSISYFAINNKYYKIGEYLQKARELLPGATEVEKEYFEMVSLWAKDLIANEPDDY